MNKKFKNVLSVFIGIMMLLQAWLPTAALADEAYVCYIGSAGYESLEAAVTAAGAGDVIWMTADDSVTESVTIDKNLTVELDGHTLSDAAIKFSGDITVKLNDRVGTSKFNTNKNSGFKSTDYTDTRVRTPLYLTGGANVIITGTTGGTEFYGGGQCTNGLTYLEKAAVVGQNCSLTVNGASLIYSGYTGTDGVFVCKNGTMTLNDVLISRFTENKSGCSISYAYAPTEEYPLTITKGLFYGSMWKETTGRLTFDEIESEFLCTSEGSYIDYDKSKSTDGWEIYIASSKLSTKTDIENIVDTAEALRVSAGGDITANEGQKVVFEPQVTGGDGESAITYSWSFNGKNIGASAASYTVEAAAKQDAGAYVFTATQGTSTVSCTYNLTVNAQSKLFSTSDEDNLLSRAVDSGFVSAVDKILGVSFVNLSDYDLTGKTTVDYSADKDESVLAWYDSDSSMLYIGGYGKIIAGSLCGAFYYGENINSITGIELLDTSNTTSMKDMFIMCGVESKTFTLDLGDNFDTSKVTDMRRMFDRCGESSTVFELKLGDKFDTSNVTDMNCMFARCGYTNTSFTLDLGDKFDTSNVTDMCNMFSQCGRSSKVFTLDLGDKFNTEKVTDMSYMFCSTGEDSDVFKELDLSGFTVNISRRYDLSRFAANSPVTTFIFGEGWANAALPPAGSAYGFAYSTLNMPTTVIGATKNLLSYNWAADNRTVTFPGKEYYTITAVAETGGTASGGGEKVEGSSVTLTATANDGYTFEGWYDGDTKVCDTEKFVIETVTGDKTYTAKFTKNIVYYTISAEVGTAGGGTVSGGGEVAEGGSITLTAVANDGYTFEGWYDGDTKVCDTAEFVVETVTADKTYTAKFTKNQVVDPTPEPSGFDFTSLRTLKTKNITVNHETKTIDIEAADNAADYITIFVHQKDVIPGGTFKMASYLGNKVVYDKNGSYRVYYVHNFTVPVKANITINGVTEQYSVNVHFDSSKAGFNFTSLKGENFSDVTVNHDDKTVHITANDSADNIKLYVNQHDTVYGGKLRMASYLGNKVNYDASGVYTIYANQKNSVSVKANITINGVTEQYLITVDFPAIGWGFDTVNADNVKNVSIDHENKVITIDTTEGCDSILLYIDQICQSNVKGQIWMKSYMGNKVVYNAADRTYTIAKKDKNSITVKTKITMLGETRYYDININFTENE